MGFTMTAIIDYMGTHDDQKFAHALTRTISKQQRYKLNIITNIFNNKIQTVSLLLIALL